MEGAQASGRGGLHTPPLLQGALAWHQRCEDRGRMLPDDARVSRFGFALTTTYHSIAV